MLGLRARAVNLIGRFCVQAREGQQQTVCMRQCVNTISYLVLWAVEPEKCRCVCESRSRRVESRSNFFRQVDDYLRPKCSVEWLIERESANAKMQYNVCKARHRMSLCGGVNNGGAMSHFCHQCQLAKVSRKGSSCLVFANEHHLTID